jgi:hypothetical protein
MSKSVEHGCTGETSGQSHCCRRPRVRGHCPRMDFRNKTQGTGTVDGSSQKDHHHDSGTCPFLAKVRGCCSEGKEEKCERVPQECATWMCWFYYTLGRHGSDCLGQNYGGFVPPCFGDSDSSDSEDENVEAKGMDTEAAGEEKTAEPEGDANDEKETGNEKEPIPVEFVQWACWAYYMMGAHEAGGPPHMGPPHMGPWGHHFGPRPFTHSGFGGFGPCGSPFMHGEGYGPLGYSGMGDFGHHHGPPPFGPFGGFHSHHGRHGPPFLFPGMSGFGGMFGGPHRGHWGHRHHRGGPHCGRGGIKGHHGHPSCCPRMWLSKAEKTDTAKKTE